MSGEDTISTTIFIISLMLNLIKTVSNLFGSLSSWETVLSDANKSVICQSCY